MKEQEIVRIIRDMLAAEEKVIAEYLKAMPKLSQQLDETIAKVHHIYDQLKQ